MLDEKDIRLQQMGASSSRKDTEIATLQQTIENLQNQVKSYQEEVEFFQSQPLMQYEFARAPRSSNQVNRTQDNVVPLPLMKNPSNSMLSQWGQTQVDNNTAVLDSVCGINTTDAGADNGDNDTKMDDSGNGNDNNTKYKPNCIPCYYDYN